MAGVKRRVVCTWQLLVLAVKGPCMVGIGLANSHPGCMSQLRIHYSHRLGGSFLAGNASSAPSGCLPAKSADYIACTLMSKMDKVASLLVKPESPLVLSWV